MPRNTNSCTVLNAEAHPLIEGQKVSITERLRLAQWRSDLYMESSLENEAQIRLSIHAVNAAINGRSSQEDLVSK